MIFFSFLLSTLTFASNQPLPLFPAQEITSGALCSESDKDYSARRYAEHIPYCARNVSGKLKAQVYNSYGVPSECRNEYTIDHFYPLSLGGNNARANLWPEHKAIKAIRQNLEQNLYDLLLKGKITQEQALREIHEAKIHPNLSQIVSGNYCDLIAPSITTDSQ